VRVYVPLAWSDLRALQDGPVRVEQAHAVTADVRRELGTDDDEELEYAVLGAAAADAVGLVTPEHPRRLVVVADLPAEPLELSAVALQGELALKDLLAIHADPPGRRTGDAEDQDLGWYGVQEIDQLLD
jgi:hypothetical protein